MNIQIEKLDLDINNYELNDLLSLFSITNKLTKEELKNAKRLVLMTHPDKSKLDKKIFFFYSSAYKILLSVYEYRNKRETKDTEYKVDIDVEKKSILDKHLNNERFNEWFNEAFENTKAGDLLKEEGYTDWLKSEEGLYKSPDRMSKAAFEKHKKDIRDIIPHKDILELGHVGNFHELGAKNPEFYEANLFSSLQYDDIRRAHTETVVPVTEQDGIRGDEYRTLEALRNERSKMTEPHSFKQAKNYLDKRRNQENADNIDRTYRLVKEDESSLKKTDEWWSYFKQIKK